MKGRERSMAIRSGINKQGWEKSDFPVACEKCYGENTSIRMLKEDYGQECRICFRPFTVFKWKGDRGIYKRTCVCESCSKQKNICQVCTLDLEFGLPMEVRDRRCGKNGKHLLDQNFTSLDNMKVKPPPPQGPPPMSKEDPSQKELVYVPERDSDDQQEQKTSKQNENEVENKQNENAQKNQQNLGNPQINNQNQHKQQIVDQSA